MRNNDGNSRSFFYSKFFILLVLLAAAFVAFAFLRSFYQDYQVRQEIERLKSEAENLEAKKLEMLEILKYVSSEEYAEEKARLEFNMIKPGEQTAVIKRGSSTFIQSGQVDNKMLESNSLSNPLKWLNIFLK